MLLCVWPRWRPMVQRFSTLLSDLVTRYGLELVKPEFDRLMSVLFVNREFVGAVPDFEHETAYKTSVRLMEEDKNKRAIAEAVAIQLAATNKKHNRGNRDGGGREPGNEGGGGKRKKNLCPFFNRKDGVCKPPSGVCQMEHECSSCGAKDHGRSNCNNATADPAKAGKAESE
jgi:hypothetical protein